MRERERERERESEREKATPACTALFMPRGRERATRSGH